MLKKQNADLEDVDLSFEESSTPSSETDSEHEEQLGMSLKNLPGNLMSSQQGHFEQVAQSTKNCPDSVDSEAIRALKTQLGGKHFIRTKKQRVGEMHRLSLEISKKLQSTGKLSLSLKHFIYLTNRFQVAMHLFSNRSQMMSKCGKNKKVAREVQLSVSLMFLPHFDVLCDLLLNRHTAIWNLFVLYNKELKKF